MQRRCLALQGKKEGQTLGIKWREHETQKKREMGLSYQNMSTQYESKK